MRNTPSTSQGISTRGRSLIRLKTAVGSCSTLSRSSASPSALLVPDVLGVWMEADTGSPEGVGSAPNIERETGPSQPRHADVGSRQRPMIPSLAVTVGLLVQAAAHPVPARAARAPDPVRVWRTDSIAYVALREPGHLLLLLVDPIGRIQVLFPFGPYDSTGVDAEVPFTVPLPPEAQGNPATLIAIRSRWAFDFAALRGGAGGTWNYQDAWLLQPTAGDSIGPWSRPRPRPQRRGHPSAPRIRSRHASSCLPAPSCGRLPAGVPNAGPAGLPPPSASSCGSLRCGR